MDAPFSPPAAPWVCLQAAPDRWLTFQEPVEILEAWDINQVLSLLHRLEVQVEKEGLYAAGFLAYEAAPAFDSALRVRAPDPFLPLAWFGLFTAASERSDLGEGAPPGFSLGEWQPEMNLEQYQEAFARVKAFIAAGKTYQVNLTYRMRAEFTGSPWGLFRQLAGAQQGCHAAFVDTGRHALVSASPELFFQRQGEALVSRPMKGTAPRGLTLAQDEEQACWLAGSEKNRAENVMIVDMIRNDMGRVAETGSVHVPELYAIERYPTVLQMTSTVRCRTRAPLVEVFKALYPCASITGAPKVRTMGIIADLEASPRGAYTGAIGYAAPGRQARFNVAIRTVTIDRQREAAEYGVGGGVVWDSDPAREYEECRLKARVLSTARPAFELLETMLWEPDHGYFLLEDHLARLTDSATYFGFPPPSTALRRRLAELPAGLDDRPHRVRVLVGRTGRARVQVQPLELDPAPRAWRVALAPEAVDAADPFLYHKTTHRAVYERARAAHPDCDDVLLWNGRGELTESTLANLVVSRGGRLVTPPVSCGLLPGTFRQHLLARGEIQEEVIQVSELLAGERFFLINSVRKWSPAELVLP